ncbi:hypothetical protein [Subtercola lobariae]|uniref:hypothetical protein n=1 Tax=Subtercola lobariae TaxID=1588641 RepID=UPI00166E5968|nr:hypothetical protein [Subtercola lobariae]
MKRGFVWAIGLLIAGGIALRLVVLLSPGFTVNADRAVVYLIALHASKGDFSALYWGQQYGGTAISWIAGGIMAVSVASPYVLYGVTLGMIAVSAVLLCRLTLLALGRTAAVVATAIFAFPGSYLVSQTTDDGGFYISSVLFGLLAIWLAVDHPLRLPRLRIVGVGLSIGLALWCSPMGFAIALPAALLVVYNRRRVSSVLLLLPGFAVGVLIYLWGLEQWRAGGEAMSQKTTLFADIFDRTQALFYVLMPAGVPLGHGRGLVLVGTIVIALIVVLIIGAWRDRTGITFAFAVGLVLLTVVFVLSGILLVPSAARYDEFFLPGLAFAVAAVAARVFAFIGGALSRQSTRRAVWIVAGCTAVLVVVATTITVRGSANLIALSASAAAAREAAGLPTAPAPDGLVMFGEDYALVDSYLESRGITAVWATYWTSYSLAAVSNERVTAADIEFGRYAPYRAAAAGVTPGVIIEPTGSDVAQTLATSTTLPYAEMIPNVGGSSIFIYSHPVTGAQLSSVTFTGFATSSD